MKSLIANVFLVSIQSTSVHSLHGSTCVFFNKAYTHAQSQLTGIRNSTGVTWEGGSMMVRNLQLINHLLIGH